MGNDETIDLSELLEPKTDNREAQRSIANYCRINLQNLDQALERHPALFAYAVACFEMAKVQEAQKKWNLEVTKSTSYQFLMDSDPKMTVAGADKKIPSIPAVASAVAELHEAMSVVGRLKGLVDGLGHRRDMLVQISARQRQEMAN